MKTWTNKTQYEWRQSHIKQTCERLNITREQYEWFLKYANKLHRIFENQCNGYQDINGNWDQEASDKEETIEEKLKEKINREAKKLGLFTFFQGDPRGGSLYLDTKEIPYDNYTQAYCIY